MRQLIVILLSVCLLAACGQERIASTSSNGDNPPVSARQIDPRLADATNRFGFELLSTLRAGGADQTLISPASIAMALAMTYNGADGTTAIEMADVLQVAGMTREELSAAHQALREFLTDPNSDVTLDIANSLWARLGIPFDSVFLALNTEAFNADFSELDFDQPAAADSINGWVERKTRGKIDKIIEGIDRGTILYLINAIYFKGTWTYIFDSTKSYQREFHFPTGARERRFMWQEGEFDYYEDETIQMARLPYGKSQRFGMYIVLPRADSGLAAFLDTLTAERWRQLTGRLADREGEIHLPRFKLEWKNDLVDPLRTMGMPSAFEPNRAEFTRMIDLPDANAFISKVLHKTIMEVNEEGTVAAAVTAVEVGITSDIQPVGHFRMLVDRPFFCAIADRESGLILFMGSVSNFD
jgi:serpin B